jgi:hypothetical protein
VSKQGDHVGWEAAPLEPPPAGANPAVSGEFTPDTSLADLLQAILGAEAGRGHDQSAHAQVVDAQIRALRQELGIPEPVERPVPSDPFGVRELFATGSEDGDDGVHPPGGRRPSWRNLVSGLADRAKHSVGLMLLVSVAQTIA